MTGRPLRSRIAATAILFGAILLVLVVRAAELTLARGSEFRQRADLQHLLTLPLPAPRGPIVDRNGEPLVLTRESAAVYMRPRKLTAGPEALAALAQLLDLEPREVAQRAAAKVPFVWLNRQVSLDRWADVERLGLSGIGSESTRQRVYPHGALAGHVLGFTGIDGRGLEGVELMFDADLCGEVEALAVERDARGRQLLLGGGRGPLPRAGARVELTIDASLQRVAETELERAVLEFEAAAGSVVVLAPKTGEVLAMANVPRFDPNLFRHASPDVWRNRAVTDSYEPGSTLKAILAAAALDSGLAEPDDRIFCENGRYQIGRRVVRDHHPHGVLSFADVIAQSSNIGAAKVAERLGRRQFAAALDRFGFGRATEINLPGEAAGLVRSEDRWGRIHLATIAFGQGIAVTPLQLTRAFAAIANGGRLMRPYAVRRIVADDGTVIDVGRQEVERQVISRETAATVTDILVRAVESGTGKLARLDGFAVAGKTGTAQKVDPTTGRYHPRHRMSSFVGYVPAEDPALVILVVVDTPRKYTYGGVVAAPVFRRIAEYGLAQRGVFRRDLPQRVWARSGEAPPQLVTTAPAAPSEDGGGGVPSFLGCSVREALVRADKGGWEVKIEGAGYVVAQEPPPGTPEWSREVTLRFGSAVS